MEEKASWAVPGMKTEYQEYSYLNNCWVDKMRAGGLQLLSDCLFELRSQPVDVKQEVHRGSFEVIQTQLCYREICCQWPDLWSAV